MDIQTVELQSLDDLGRSDEVVSRIGEALRAPGFFILEIDGMLPVVENALRAWHTFCALPLAQKSAWHWSGVRGAAAGGKSGVPRWQTHYESLARSRE